MKIKTSIWSKMKFPTLVEAKWFLQETCFLWLKSKRENVGGSSCLTTKSQPIGWWSFHTTEAQTLAFHLLQYCHTLTKWKRNKGFLQTHSKSLMEYLGLFYLSKVPSSSKLQIQTMWKIMRAKSQNNSGTWELSLTLELWFMKNDKWISLGC